MTDRSKKIFFDLAGIIRSILIYETRHVGGVVFHVEW